MTHRLQILAAAAGVIACAMSQDVSAQEPVDPPIRFEVGGTPGGGMFLTGGDDDTEANFNVYTFSANVAYYLTQRLAVEGEYMFGNGWGQDVVFRQGLLVGQQLPFSNAFTGGVLYYPKGATGTALPFYVGGGMGVMSLISRPTTVKVNYDSDIVGSESFMVSRIGGGIKLPQGAGAPNWAFRLDYRLIVISRNDNAPLFFARNKSRTGHQFQFGIQYAFRRR